MISFLGADDAVGSMIEFFQGIVGGLNLDIILFIFVGILAAFFVAAIIRLIWCYESRAMRQMRKINKYLKENPKINDSNLVEFHKKMRGLPRRFRDRWQLFMLEREGSPSRYMTVEYCVKRPLYNSAILTVKKQIGYATVVICILSLLFSIAYINITAADRVITITMLMQALLTPLFCGLFGCIFCMILHLRYTAVNNSLYDIFTNFIRNIDKSTNAMPDYVDYELLFTPKEINAGIPVLREYLEKRALEEQRLLEKAKQEEANHSPYNFADLGVNGSQLIERAVTESEKFMMSKMQIQQEITDLEKQLQKSEANKEDIEREANRKLQAIKENLERLDKAMAETTNRVEINYNRRQATEEMNKKAKLEKDLETMLNKEQVAIDALKVEIQKRKEVIEENKEAVETALKSEYDTFATKVYQELSDKVTRDNSEQMRDLEMVIARLKAKVQEYNKDLEKRDNLVEARSIEVENLRRELNKAKNLLKNNSKNRGKGGKSAEDIDNLIKEPTHYEPKNEEKVETQPEASTDHFEPVPPAPADEFVAEAPAPQDQFEEVPADNFVPEQPAEQFVEEPVQEQFAPVNEQPMQYAEAPQDEFVAPVEQFEPQQDFVAQNAERPQDNFVPVDNGEFAPTQMPQDNFAPVEQTPVEQTQNTPVEVVEPAPVVEEKDKAEENKEKKGNSLGQVKKSGVKIARPGKKVEESKSKEAELDADQMKKRVDELHEELQKSKQEIKEIKEEQRNAEQEKITAEAEKVAAEKEKKAAEKDELEALQEQINVENERLKKQQEELRAQIDETLKTMEKATNATKAERTRNIKKIKDLIAQLKQEAADAKQRGASKAEISKINKSAAELLKVIADYQANKPITNREYNR